MNMTKAARHIFLLLLLIVLLLVANLLVGSVAIPAGEVLRILMGEDAGRESWHYIVWEARLPQALTALLAGSALAVCGLLLQITAAGFSFSGFFSILLGAFAGAMAVMALILFFSTLVRSHVMLLIIGLMVGYLVSSVVSLLNFLATAEGVQSYMVWGMGNFGGVSLRQMPAFAAVVLLGLAGALLLIKPLNALLLGERYAENLGVRVRRVRHALLAVVGVLTAVTTAFCGPVLFIDLAVPHIARLLLGTANHRILLPATLLAGGAVALACNLVCLLPGEAGLIPLNAVTPLIGAPIVIYVIVSQRGMK